MAITGLCAAFFQSRARAEALSNSLFSLGLRGLRGALGALISTVLLAGCEPKLNVGDWTCRAAPPSDAGTPSLSDSVALPWSSSFEDPFCDYYQVAGSCYDDGPASHSIVTSPTHSGRFAAAFAVVGDQDDAGAAGQTRCIRQGELPPAAYYGAWYFIPATATNSGTWNLFHFRGADRAGGPTHPLWDVSLVSTPGGTLSPRVLDFMPNPGGSNIVTGRPVPIGSWFHLVFYLKRAKDATGEVALYQAGERIAGFKNRRTDDSDWGQWYVGNYATMLDPPESTLYVDDVTIEATEPID